MASETPKKLYRSRTNRMLSGFCGGLAEYFDLDPTLVRLAWVAFSLCGPGLLLYIVALFVVPSAPEKGEAKK